MNDETREFTSIGIEELAKLRAELATAIAEVKAGRSGEYLQMCQAVNTQMSKTIGKLRAQIAEYDESYRRVMSEDCAPDEKHCTCVPALRAWIKELEAKNLHYDANVCPEKNRRIAELEAAKSETCTWKRTGDFERNEWNGDCGAEWMFTDGGPVENEVSFCPKCGRKLIEVPLEAHEVEDV
jgi:predicted  nucleic acid-binding Zn-ribbon protein